MIHRALSRFEAEERGQGEAIARNIFDMCRLKTPIISVIVGEGASGGALGIGVGDRVLMMEKLVFSYFSRSCSSILWKSWGVQRASCRSIEIDFCRYEKTKISG